jgi:hypothetical protein
MEHKIFGEDSIHGAGLRANQVARKAASRIARGSTGIGINNGELTAESDGGLGPRGLLTGGIR